MAQDYNKVNEEYYDQELDSLKKTYESMKVQNDMENITKSSTFNGAEEYNLAKYQLEVDDILERAEHLLRGDVIQYKNGNLIWQECPDLEDRPFNEYGVREIMQFISIFVNRNKLLSNYKIEEINQRLHVIGIALSDYIFNNYDKFGMDSLKKRTKYELIVEEIMSMIEDAYRRALGGIERDTLREKTMVHQNLNPMGQPYQMGGAGSNSQKKVSMMKPWTWF